MCNINTINNKDNNLYHNFSKVNFYNQRYYTSFL
nr:MAG TPA: hypothetical protein [Caudoviricetes sp.]